MTAVSATAMWTTPHTPSVPPFTIPRGTSCLDATGNPLFVVAAELPCSCHPGHESRFSFLSDTGGSHDPGYATGRWTELSKLKPIGGFKFLFIPVHFCMKGGRCKGPPVGFRISRFGLFVQPLIGKTNPGRFEDRST